MLRPKCLTSQRTLVSPRLRLVILILTLLVLAACGGGSSSTPSTPVITSITLSPIAPSTTVGNTQQFTATASYNTGPNQDVTASATWSSSNANIASVQSTGQASPGLAT